MVSRIMVRIRVIHDKVTFRLRPNVRDRRNVSQKNKPEIWNLHRRPNFIEVIFLITFSILCVLRQELKWEH